MAAAQTFPENQRRSAETAFGQFRAEQGRHIFSREHTSGYDPIVTEAAPRTYFIQPGMVNVALFETDEGLLLVDCGCAGDGPALLRAVRSLSDRPLHTVVYTHGHIDHAFGLWAFLADPDDEEAQQCYVDVFEQRAAAEPSLMAQVNFRASKKLVARAREEGSGRD